MFKIHTELQIKDDANVFVVTDIHGMVDLLIKTLVKAKYDPEKDLLISLGDLIDRGPLSLETLMYFIDKPNVLSLAGNHEEMMVNTFLGTSNAAASRALWESNYGEWNNKYDAEFMECLAKKMIKQFYYAATLTLKCGTRFGLTHGGFTERKWDPCEFYNYPANMLSQLLWNRDKAKANPRFDFNITGVDFTVHGHTPKIKPFMNNNSIFFDTYACSTRGELTVLDLNKFSRTHSLEESTFTTENKAHLNK